MTKGSRGRKVETITNRLSFLKHALVAKGAPLIMKVGGGTNQSSFNPADLSKANQSLFRLLRDVLSGNAEALRDMLKKWGLTERQVGPQQMALQLVARHDLCNFYSIPNEIRYWCMVPGLHGAVDQVSMATHLQSHNLFKTDLRHAREVVIEGDSFTKTLNACLNKVKVDRTNLHGWTFAALLAAYSRFAPFAKGVIAFRCAKPQDVEARLCEATAAKVENLSPGKDLAFGFTTSLVGVYGPFGHKKTSHSYDLSTFTIRKFVSRSMYTYRDICKTILEFL